ncbi:phosphatidylserine decarboxylase, variant 4 [Coprinopsis cinerea AmutBmut pab1-1]|nr:phosphatidylserine decarboxylase, variant 4 [Coprinopsis cinerea AmutBmut pab1-1]
MHLLAADRGGTSDPFVVASILNNRNQTPVAKKTLNPTYTPKDATFDFPLYLSLADKLGVLELVVWDKDIVGKDYLGEVGLPLDEWFVERVQGAEMKERPFGWEDSGNKPFSVNLLSTRAQTTVTGSVQIKLGFVLPPNVANPPAFEAVYKDLVKRSRPSLVSAPPTEGVGTIRSTHGGPAPLFEDDGGLSSESEAEGDDDDDNDDDDEDEDNDLDGDEDGGSGLMLGAGHPVSELVLEPESLVTLPSGEKAQGQGAAGVGAGVGGDRDGDPGTAKPPGVEDVKTPTPMSMSITETPTIVPSTTAPTPQVAAPTPKVSTGFIPKMKAFPRKLSSKSASSMSGTSTPPTTLSTAASSGSVLPTLATTPNRSETSSPAVSEGVGVGAEGAKGVGVGVGVGVAAEGGAKDKKGSKATKEGKKGKGKGAKKGKKRRGEYKLDHANDILGIVMLEIQGAEDLPRLSNMTRTGWDMDPFVVISFGKKVFRTRVIRHSRNPVWDEKLIFHVRRYEAGFKVHFSILDWDKLSANDHIGDASFDVKLLIDEAPQPDPETGLYPPEEDGSKHPMKDMKLKLEVPKSGWGEKFSPSISVRAKYQPYAALRQRFWRQYLKQYDTDDTNTMSHLELTSMLDSLGSTLTADTIQGWFEQFGKDVQTGELTFEEAIMALEAELGKEESEKRKVDATSGGGVGLKDKDEVGSSSATPVVLQGLDAQGREIRLEELDFSGQPRVQREESSGSTSDVSGAGVGVGVVPPAPVPTAPLQQPLTEVVAEGEKTASGVEAKEEEEEEDGSTTAAPTATATATSTTSKKKKLRFGRKKTQTLPSGGLNTPGTVSGDTSDVSTPGSTTSSSSSSSSSSGSGGGGEQVERVINVKNCPMCHRPRMGSKGEMDIITHLAICASQDWNAVDKIMVGNFVTASQAQRKWYTKVLSKVSSGNYKLGANSANIIVQNRMTGQLEEEKMQVYVRLGIRLLYKGASSQMEGARARRLLKSLSIKQGIKYDDPASAKEIPGFIEFHNLNVDEVLDPLDSFKTFNEFFYRKLKPSARPVESPDDPYRLVSAADCRFMAFETVSAATKIWIKGRDFSVSKLLGEEYKADVDRYDGGALAIFRLAPQDYHRFHSPVDGVVGKMTYIAGEYYTVNPQAIRTALDVYGENARKIVPFDSPQFGRVMAVCVGAMMVGSIETTVEEGQTVKRGDEFGYFAFGGSTIVILFEKGAVEWDEDLLINGRASLETLVRVGMGIGRGDPAKFN